MKKLLFSTIIGTAISLSFGVSSFAASNSFSNTDTYSEQLLEDINTGLEEFTKQSNEVEIDSEKVKDQIKKADMSSNLSDEELESLADKVVEGYTELNENDICAQDWGLIPHVHLPKTAWATSKEEPVLEEGVPDYVRNRLSWDIQKTFETTSSVKITVGLEAGLNVKKVFNGKISGSAEGEITAKEGETLPVPAQKAIKRVAWIRTQTENVAVQYGKYYINPNSLPMYTYAGYSYDTYDYGIKNVVVVGRGVDYDEINVNGF